MFYVAADNDLEEAEIADLEEVLSAPSSPQVRITALVDRSGTGSQRPLPGQGDWKGARWLTLSHEARLIEDWGPQNMADPAVLQRFLSQARAAFPARRYALFIADHGEGWRGICLDGEQLMDPAALGRALEGPPLDLVGLDACLMGTVEVATALAPHARYLVASEEFLPWSGFAYRAPLTRLAAQPQSDARQLGAWLVGSFGPSLAADERETATLALLDLQHLPRVAELAAEWERRPWSELARAREQSEQFGLSAEPGVPDAAQFDLFDLAERLGQPLPGRAVVTSFGRRGGGLAVHFPTQADPDYTFPGWSGLVRTFTRGARRGQPELGRLERVGPMLRARLGHPEEVRAAWLVLARDGWIMGRQPSAPEGEWLRDTFDGSWLQLGGQLCPVAEVQHRDSRDLAVLPAQWHPGDLAWSDVTLTLVLDLAREDQAGRVAGLTHRGQAVRRQEGDELRLPEERLKDGERRYGEAVPFGPVSLQPIPPGRYEVGFLVETWSGRRLWRTLAVEVE